METFVSLNPKSKGARNAVRVTKNASGGERTSGNDIIHDQHFLPRLHSIALDLEPIFTIFLLEAGLLGRAWQLATLPDGCKASVEPQGKTGTEQEASSIERDNDIGLDAAKGGEDLAFEGDEQRVVQVGRGKERQDIDKVDAGNGEVGEVAKGRVEG